MMLFRGLCSITLFSFLLVVVRSQYTEPNCDGKQVIVQLFEWPWDAVGRECEEFLGPMGYCGVQVSPPQEHIQGSEWWTRYQPVSYKLESRSGNRDQFANMVKRCNNAGVNVIVNFVVNHMTGHGMSGTGTGGSSFNGNNEDYPAVPYSSLDFHQPYCEINDYHNVDEVRNCYLVSLNDLNGGKDYVRDKIAEYANDLFGLGVKGLRFDASKHMWPGDLEAIQGRFNDVDGNKPLCIHEVIADGPIQTPEYYSVGKVTEFNGCYFLECIRGGDLNCLYNYAQGWSDGMHALVFVDNHDNQRGGGVLTYKEDYNYKLASGFLLAHPYGFKRVMSSYDFTDFDQGPPSSPPNSVTDGACGNGWICEHRWSTIADMIQFSNAVAGEPLTNWQVKDGSLGFARGSKGFFAMGNLNNVEFEVGSVPDGEYCDIVHNCQQKIYVSGGRARFNKAQGNDPVAAICIGCN